MPGAKLLLQIDKPREEDLVSHVEMLCKEIVSVVPDG